jgi:bile-acid 7alpha-dehydratase
MADLADLERRLQRLEDIEAIKQLKYRYWRHLDLKQWDELARCFAPDATVCYSSGKYEFAGVDAIMGFLSQALGRARGSVTIHHGHHPEIALLDAHTATGTWALYNYMFNAGENRGIRIGAYYEDRYVERDGAWLFQHIGYRYIFHEEWQRSDVPSLHLVE